MTSPRILPSFAFAFVAASLLAAGGAFAQPPGNGNGNGPPNNPPGKEVLVINTPAEAVPVVTQGVTAIQGNVAVTNTPSVNVANTPNVNVANTPNVNVANTPSVNVANTPGVNVLNVPTVKAQQDGSWTVAIGGTPAVSVTNPVLRVSDVPFALEVFQDNIEVTLLPGEGGKFVPVPVPPGKLLVIEYMSAFVSTPLGQQVDFDVITHMQGMQHVVFLPPSVAKDWTGRSEHTLSGPVRIYNDGSTIGINPTLGFVFRRDSAVDSAAANVSISGRLVEP